MVGQARLLREQRALIAQRLHESFAPQQTGLTGLRPIPSRRFQIDTGERGYCELMESRRDRARRISSKLVGPHQIPVTPIVNPITGASFHIIDMFSRWKQGYAVDLLIRDVDGYIVAFRRRRIHDQVWQQGRWYKYKDVKDLPREIEENCTPLSFNSSHGESSRTKPGGIRVLRDMFEVLATFQDCNRDQNEKLLNSKDEDRVYEALLKAIVIFCEALRFRSVYLAVRARIRDDEWPSELHSTLWNLFRVWGQSSVDVLEMCVDSVDLPALNTEAPKHLLNRQVWRPGMDELVTLATLDDAVGSAGELMYLKARPDLIMSDAKRALVEDIIRQRKVPARPEPGFQDVALDME